MNKDKKRFAWLTCYPRQYPHSNDWTIRQKYHQIFRIARVLRDAEKMNKSYCGWDDYRAPALNSLVTDNETSVIYWLAYESLRARENKEFTGWVNYGRWKEYWNKRGRIPF